MLHIGSAMFALIMPGDTRVPKAVRPKTELNLGAWTPLPSLPTKTVLDSQAYILSPLEPKRRMRTSGPTSNEFQTAAVSWPASVIYLKSSASRLSKPIVIDPTIHGSNLHSHGIDGKIICLFLRCNLQQLVLASLTTPARSLTDTSYAF